MKPAIRVENLSKMYRLGETQSNGYRTLRESIMDGVAALWPGQGGESQPKAATTLWALRDVSFEVRRSEVLGVIGRNGAGKSTLLKILSRITEPTGGRVEMRGRIASLLEVGTGFHPELTGRENIYLNGSILGMTRREIDAKFSEIVAFSEIGPFLDTPVKRYSSGMYVRLAFAVAAHLESEILVVDEVLAVGDAAFQQRCLRKMHEIARSGRTVFFVSHNLASVRSLCQKAIVLDRGTLISEGRADEQVACYLADLARFAQEPLAQRTDRKGNGRARLVDLLLTDEGGARVDTVTAGSSLGIAVDYRTQAIGSRATLAFSCWSAEGHKVFHLDNQSRGTDLPPLSAEGRIVCRIPRLPLVPGRYHLNVLLTVDEEVAEHIPSATYFEVLPGDYYSSQHLTPSHGGVVFVDHDWDTLEGSGVGTPVIPREASSRD